MNRKVSVITAIVLLTLAVLGIAQIQPPKQPARQLVLLRAVQLKPEAAREWQDWMKSEYIPALKKAGTPWYTTLRRSNFGSAGQALQAWPITGLSQLDAPDPLRKTLGEDGATALYSKLPKFIAGYKVLLLASRPDLSVGPPAGYEPKIVVQDITRVTPGRTGEYEEYLKRFVTVVKKTGLKGTIVAKVMQGGDKNEYQAFIFFDSYAEMEKVSAESSKAMQESKLSPLPAGIVQHSERSTFRFAPEMSIEPAAGKP